MSDLTELKSLGRAWSALNDILTHIEEDQQQLAFELERRALSIIDTHEVPEFTVELIGVDAFRCTFLVTGYDEATDREITWEELDAASV